MKETKLVTLCGEWGITKDPENNGRENGWQKAIPDAEIRRIHIYDHMPNSYWTMALSYSNVFPKYHGYVWYYKSIPTVPTLAEGERMLLEFERAGYVCEAFVNGVRVDSSFTMPGLAIGEYAFSEGRCVLNSFPIFSFIGKHPFADILLLNIVKTYA